MTRTIVISDAHGYPELILNALAHSGFAAGEDHLVFAGDFVDRGDRPQECLGLSWPCAAVRTRTRSRG